MTLRAELVALVAERDAELRAMYDALADRLATGVAEAGPRSGDMMPDFVLPGSDGELVFSDDLLAAGPLVVVFFRGDWCPFCTATLVALNEIAPEVIGAGAGLVAISPDIGDYQREACLKLGLRFPVLSDIDQAIGLRFGTTYVVPEPLRAVWSSAGIDLEARHGDGGEMQPMPATFIADRSGVLRFAHVSGDVTDRVEPADIVRLVREMAR